MGEGPGLLWLPPPVMLSRCPAVRGGTWAGHNSCHLIVTPPYFSYGSPSFTFAVSPPEPSLLPGTDNAAAAVCRGRGAGGRAEALPVASCAGQHQHAASIARVAACSPQLIPSAPPVLPTGHGTEVKWLQRGQEQGEDRHASLPACRQLPPPSLCGLGSPKILPGKVPLRTQHLPYIRERRGAALAAKAPARSIPLAWTVQGASRNAEVNAAPARGGGTPIRAAQTGGMLVHHRVVVPGTQEPSPVPAGPEQHRAWLSLGGHGPSSEEGAARR